MEARYEHGEWVVTAMWHAESAPRISRRDTDMMPSPQEMFARIGSLQLEMDQLAERYNDAIRREVWRGLRDIGENINWSEVKAWNMKRLNQASLFVKARKCVQVAQSAAFAGPVYGGTAALRPMFLGGNWADHLRVLWTEDDACRAARDETREQVEDAFLRIFGFPMGDAPFMEEYCNGDEVFELLVQSVPW